MNIFEIIIKKLECSNVYRSNMHALAEAKQPRLVHALASSSLIDYNGKTSIPMPRHYPHHH